MTKVRRPVPSMGESIWKAIILTLIILIFLSSCALGTLPCPTYGDSKQKLHHSVKPPKKFQGKKRMFRRR